MLPYELLIIITKDGQELTEEVPRAYCTAIELIAEGTAYLFEVGK